jgi:zinc transport system substrate-binding protein
MRGWIILLSPLLWLMSGFLPARAAGIQVFVSIAPQKYFVAKVGGALVEISVLAPPGADPHTFEPKPRQMAALARAAVYFSVGVDFEKAWMPRISAAGPNLRIVATDAGIAKMAMAAEHHLTGRAGGHPAGAKAPAAGHPPHDDHEGGEDAHIWLSPPLVKIQARHIAEALSAVDPGNRARYEANLAAFLEEIESLDGELKAVFAGSSGSRFLVFHPSWGYFARDYGLEQVAIEVEGKEPKPAQLKALIEFARNKGVQAVFAQPQQSSRSAEMVAREIGGRVVSADPLAEDWAANLRAVARQFKAALR